MIKKSCFEEELIAGMQKNLIKQASNQETDKLENAVDYLHSAIEILEDSGFSAKAEKILQILEKIGQNDLQSQATKHKKPKRPDKIVDRHTKGLTPEKMVKNLLHHGTEFNMSDDPFSLDTNADDDLLDMDLSDDLLLVDEADLPEIEDFEDEKE